MLATYNTVSCNSFVAQNLCSFNVEEKLLQNFPPHLNEIMKLQYRGRYVVSGNLHVLNDVNYC